MLRIVKTVNAENDLEEIWLYSFGKWNEDQADRYYDELSEGINRLIDNPKLGKSYNSVRSGYRYIQINHHVVYYRIDAEKIRIIRVLHESMLPTKHL